ncbi:MAG: dipeptidase PepE [Bacteroidales bacterium]|nr:dipeptidase PepE [Bacteroidales bacterium]MDD4671986.1 dipeptidase PepE [Bacteroidales bacterium]MDY0347192.1 dipeptidase PepE [Tenuifilaceae bacterium]
MRLLLISNSTNAGEEYLQHPLPAIGDFLKGVKKVLFIPFAAVTYSFDEYEKKVQKRFDEFGIQVDSIHHHRNAKVAVHSAEAFVVGGGNTFRLLKMIQQLDIIEALRYRVLDGTPYVGWSAGSNMACPTICTTNDMPIVEPDSFSAFNLIRFQINPHYLDANPSGHAGETREQRINEFIALDPFSYVVGLREGSILKVEGGDITLLGDKSLRVFKHQAEPKEYKPGDNLDFLFE